MIQELANKGIMVTGKRFEQGKTNLVYPVEIDGQKAVCKIYCNKYFPEQQTYEKEVLRELAVAGILVPKVMNEGLLGNSKYSVITRVEGRSLAEETPECYVKTVGDFLRTLHHTKIMPGVMHPLQSNPELIVQKALRIIDDSRVYAAYATTAFKRTGKVFCHRDPNFKHIFFGGELLTGFVDFEDAMYLEEEVDYASFLRDQIELRRQKEEIREFLEVYGGNPEQLSAYLARLYILDLGFGHGLVQKSKEDYIKDILLLLSPMPLEEKISYLRGEMCDY